MSDLSEIIRDYSWEKFVEEMQYLLMVWTSGRGHPVLNVVEYPPLATL